MTDKITIQEAITELKECYLVQSDDEGRRRNKAVTMAIEALEQNAELKAIIEDWYLDKRDISARIDGVACEHCSRKVNGVCELPDNERCAQTGEEALGLFWKYGLGE